MELATKFHYLIILFSTLAFLDAFFVIYRVSHQDNPSKDQIYSLIVRLLAFSLLIGILLFVQNLPSTTEWFIHSQWIDKVNSFLKFITFGAENPEVISKRITYWIIGLPSIPIVILFLKSKILSWKNIKNFFIAWKNEWIK